ncbi:MAG: UbiA-like protein EboC [Flavobacteriaceae bacterium]|nr:UbiA-like protein EboC [Flavobacteriaceae bacterium]
MDVFLGYLRLCRPANLPTAAADILAGMALAGTFDATGIVDSSLTEIGFLVLASVFLYAGGVVLNDVFDARLDAVERPERPIPSGLVSKSNAALFGFVMLVLGVALAFWTSKLCGGIALALAVSIVLYDAFSKNHAFLGPVNMGLCRALNLFLGIGFLGNLEQWPYALVPLFFIGAVTLVSRGEVHGNNKKNIILAGLLYALVILYVTYVHLQYADGWITAMPFLVVFALMVLIPLGRSFKVNSPTNIKKAVKAGVLSIIILDAAMATAYTDWYFGVAMLLLLPLSFALAKIFAVT